MDHPTDPFTLCQDISAGVVRTQEGWSIAQLAQNPELVGWVRQLVYGDTEPDTTPLHDVLVFEPVFIKAVLALGDGERGWAAQLLTGLTTETCGQLRPYRRAAAARAMTLAVESFIHHHEKKIVQHIAAEIYRRTIFEKNQVAP